MSYLANGTDLVIRILFSREGGRFWRFMTLSVIGYDSAKVDSSAISI